MFDNLSKLGKPSNSNSSFLDSSPNNKSFSLGLTSNTPNSSNALNKQLSRKLTFTETELMKAESFCDKLKIENQDLKDQNQKLSDKITQLENQTRLLMSELERVKQVQTKNQFAQKTIVHDSTLDSLETSRDETVNGGIRRQLEATRQQLDQTKILLTQSTAEVARLNRAVSQIENISKENEVLEQQVNKLRNEKNLIQLELDETQNQTYKQETLRMLEKEGIERLENKIVELDKEIEYRNQKIEELEGVIREKEIITQELSILSEQKISIFSQEVADRLRFKNQVILLLKDEINRLKENKVFVFEPGISSELCGEIYAELLNMKAETGHKTRPGEITRLKEKEPWSPVKKSHGPKLPQSDSKLLTHSKFSQSKEAHLEIEKPEKINDFPDFKDLSILAKPSHQSKNLFDDSTLFANNSRKNHNQNSFLKQKDAFFRTEAEPSSEMESILKSKLDILHDNNQSLAFELKSKNETIKTLNEQVEASKTLIQENLQIMSREQESRKLKHFIVQNLTDKLQNGKKIGVAVDNAESMNIRDVRGIRKKMGDFTEQLKLCYGSCIDLFLGMDKDSLVLLERRLNECISLDKDIQANLFGEKIDQL